MINQTRQIHQFVGDGQRSVLQRALAGRYRVDHAIGRGATAMVYAARDLRHGRQVAVKVLSLGDDKGTATDRFLREINLTAQLNCPHIVPVYDSGAAGDLLYYVMPRMLSGTLRDRIEKQGQFGIRDTLRILRDTVDALACAHACGVVHRDIKPENIMVSGHHVIVADFGIAKHMEAHGKRLSLTGKPLGTPAYMAPEQVLGGRQVDHRADIYSVGALAYEMLSGEQVFPRKTAPDILAAHLRERPRAISELRKDTPRAVAKLVMRCLEKQPDQRWPTTRKLLKEIEASLVRASRTKPRRTESIRASLRRAAAAIAFLL